MDVTVGLGIMVKTLGHSPVKTRLAQSIGREAAEEIYADCVWCVQESAAAAHAYVLPYWAVAEDGATDAWHNFPTLAQGTGGLGERMARVHTQLVRTHGAGLLVGADTPQLDPEDLRRAAAWLHADEPRLAIGPSADGGFWLFGANRAIALERWTSVAYSAASTRADFRAALAGCGAWYELGTLTDLDTVEDIEQVTEELGRLDRPTKTQLRLRGRLGELKFGDAP